MAKLRLTKNELKYQKDSLKRYLHYLPALLLKKQQLQLEIVKIYRIMRETDREIDAQIRESSEWIGVFAEGIDIKLLFKMIKIYTKQDNIAGVDMPVFDHVEFTIAPYDLMEYPIWADFGIEALKRMISLKAKKRVLEKQLELVKEELRTTTQRVNLFEKVKIPEAKENIRRIQIWLGDLSTQAVVTGKIAKAKIERGYALT